MGDRKILDVGCGTGSLLKKFAGRGVLYGVDISREMLSGARKKLPATVRLLRADSHELPFTDNYFDFVVSTEAFHHFYDQRKVVKEMMRVLRPGGKIIVVDVNLFLSPLNRLVEKIEPGATRFLSKSEMRQFFLDAGAKNISQKRTHLFSVMTLGEKPAIR